MRILITGGAGFLGSHLSEAFLKRGDEVFVLDPADSGKVEHLLSHPQFHHIRDSVLSEGMLESLALKSDLVYHLAGVVGVEHYVRDPYTVLNVNVNGTQNALKIAHRYSKKVVFASSSEVYGRNAQVPFREDDDRVLGSTRVDRWCYSTAKAVSEHFCFAFLKLGLPLVILRYFNVYGPRLDTAEGGRVVSIFLRQALRNEPVTVIGNGSQTRSFTHVDDAVRATVAAGLRSEAVGDVINIGSDQETTVLALAQAVIALTGSSSQIVFISPQGLYGEGYEDIPRRVPDIHRMKKVLGVSPTVRLEEGLRRTVEWFRHAPLHPHLNPLPLRAEHYTQIPSPLEGEGQDGGVGTVVDGAPHLDPPPRGGRKLS